MTATPPDRIEHLRIERGDNAFSRLTQEQRLRLIVQVLCGLVAYDEDTATSDEETATTVELTDGVTTSELTTVERIDDDLTERIAS